MKIRLLKDAEFDDLMALVSACYGEEAEPSSWWKWRYFNPGTGRHLIAVAEEGGVIVGMQPMTIAPFRADGRDVAAGVLTGVMVHPSCRGRGLFRKLIAYCVDAAREAGAGFVCTMPNDRSFPLFMKLGWVDPGLRTLMVDIPLRRFASQLPAGVEPLTGFGADLDELETRIAAAVDGIRLRRARAWVESRCSGNPMRDYRALQMRFGGVCEGYVAFCVDRHRRAPLGFILDVQAPDTDVRARLIQAACRELGQAGAVLALSVVASPDQIADHRKAGMWLVPPRFSPKKFHFVATPCTEEFARPGALGPIGRWQLTFADWDGV